MFRILLMIFQFCQIVPQITCCAFFVAEMGPTYLTAGLTYKEVGMSENVVYPQ